MSTTRRPRPPPLARAPPPICDHEPARSDSLHQDDAVPRLELEFFGDEFDQRGAVVIPSWGIQSVRTRYAQPHTGAFLDRRATCATGLHFTSLEGEELDFARVRCVGAGSAGANI